LLFAVITVLPGAAWAEGTAAATSPPTVRAQPSQRSLGNTTQALARSVQEAANKAADADQRAQKQPVGRPTQGNKIRGAPDAPAAVKVHVGTGVDSKGVNNGPSGGGFPTARTGLPDRFKFLGRGGMAEVHGDGRLVLKKISGPGWTEAQNRAEAEHEASAITALRNDPEFKSRFPNVLPQTRAVKLPSVGWSGIVAQREVGGHSFAELSPEAQRVANSEVVGALTLAARKMPNEIVDRWQIGNFRFSPEGKLVAWFDPFVPTGLFRDEEEIVRVHGPGLTAGR
jgi:hypothetical protein